MKKILLSICFIGFSNSIKAQDLTAVLFTQFTYDAVSDSEHHFIFHTSFTFGAGDTCPPFTGSTVAFVGDIMYVKGYYDIRGAWPAQGCDRNDMVVYSNLIPGNIGHIICSTNVTTYSGTALGYTTVENVYTRDFDLGLLTTTHNIGENNNFIMFPNPVNCFLNISESVDFNEISISNQLGQVIQNQKQYSFKNINVESLQNGIYYLTLYLKNEKKGVSKFIKQSE